MPITTSRKDARASIENRIVSRAEKLTRRQRVRQTTIISRLRVRVKPIN